MPRSRISLGRTLLAAGAVTASVLVAPPAIAVSDGAWAAGRADRTVRLGGTTVALRPGTKQVITVEHTTGWHARVVFWRKNRDGWTRIVSAKDGRTGYGGLVVGRKRQQGTGTTPLGSYRMTETFGNAKKPTGTRMPFHRVKPWDFWVQDNASRFYNQLRNRYQGGFRWWLDGENSSERLRDFRPEYRWSVVIDFNRPKAVRHRGSGIFLHVNGSGATAGCVSTPAWFIKQVMQRLRPKLVPVIAISR